MNTTKIFKKTTWLAVCLSGLLVAGCKTSVELDLDKMIKPVYIASIGSSGDVLLRDSVGNVLILNNGFYIAQSIVGGDLKAGDILIPKTIGN